MHENPNDQPRGPDGGEAGQVASGERSDAHTLRARADRRGGRGVPVRHRPGQARAARALARLLDPGPLWGTLSTGAVIGGALRIRYGESAFLFPAALAAGLAAIAVMLALAKPRSP